MVASKKTTRSKAKEGRAARAKETQDAGAARGHHADRTLTKPVMRSDDIKAEVKSREPLAGGPAQAPKKGAKGPKAKAADKEQDYILLAGSHVETEFDEDGVPVSTTEYHRDLDPNAPDVIVPSKNDLVGMFGTTKFRRLVRGGKVGKVVTKIPVIKATPEATYVEEVAVDDEGEEIDEDEAAEKAEEEEEEEEDDDED
jgi:hypothetical protein